MSHTRGPMEVWRANERSKWYVSLVGKCHDTMNNVAEFNDEADAHLFARAWKLAEAEKIRLEFDPNE